MNRKAKINIGVATIILIIAIIATINLNSSEEPVNTKAFEKEVVIEEKTTEEQVVKGGTDKTNDETDDLVVQSDETQIVNVSDIEVSMTFIPEKSTEKHWVFNVALNTHTVDLDAINFVEHIKFDGNLSLEGKTNEIMGNREGSGHHVSDYIYVPKVVNGSKTILSTTQKISFTITDINGINENIIAWELGN